MLTSRSKFGGAGGLAALLWIALAAGEVPAADALAADALTTAPTHTPLLAPAPAPRARSGSSEYEPVPRRAEFLQRAAEPRPHAVSKLPYDPRHKPGDPKTLHGQRRERAAPGLTAKLLATPRKSSPPRTPTTIRR